MLILLQALTEHCLTSALSQLQSVRAMAMTNCLFLLKYAQEPPTGKVCLLMFRIAITSSSKHADFIHVQQQPVTKLHVVHIWWVKFYEYHIRLSSGKDSAPLQENVAHAISAAVAAFIPKHKGLGGALLRQMTHSHPSTPGQSDQASKLRR